MGQQQLLLLVLGIVIVGLAVVVGIQAFGENQKKANADAIVNDGVRIASDAQAWALKPTAFGGPNPVSEGLGDLTFEDIGYAADASNVYTNLNGDFTLDGTAGVNCVIITGSNATINNAVYVKVDGTGPGNIETIVNPPGGGGTLSC